MYLLKVSNRNTRTKSCKTCSNLTVKTPERREVVRTGFFNDNFEQISDLVMVLQNSTEYPGNITCAKLVVEKLGQRIELCSN